MNKEVLKKAVEACKAERKEVIETFIDELDDAQKERVMGKEKVKAHCDHFGVKPHKGKDEPKDEDKPKPKPNNKEKGGNKDD